MTNKKKIIGDFVLMRMVGFEYLYTPSLIRRLTTVLESRRIKFEFNAYEKRFRMDPSIYISKNILLYCF